MMAGLSPWRSRDGLRPRPGGRATERTFVRSAALAATLAACVLFLAFALLVPIAEVASASLRDDSGTVTLDNYRQVLGSGYFLSALLQTVAFCGATALGGTLLALPAAWRIGRGGPGATLLRAFCQANYAFGGIIYGMLMVALIGNVGLVPLTETALFGTALSSGFVYTVPGLVIAYFGFQIPRAALLLGQAVEKLDAELLHAARAMGARHGQTVWLVILPLLRGPILHASLSNFLMSLGSFGVALLVARAVPIFAALIYKEFIGYDDVGTAAAMAIVLSCAALVAALLLRRLDRSAGVVRP